MRSTLRMTSIVTAQRRTRNPRRCGTITIELTSGKLPIKQLRMESLRGDRTWYTKERAGVPKLIRVAFGT